MQACLDHNQGFWFPLNFCMALTMAPWCIACSCSLPFLTQKQNVNKTAIFLRLYFIQRLDFVFTIHSEKPASTYLHCWTKLQAMNPLSISPSQYSVARCWHPDQNRLLSYEALHTRLFKITGKHFLNPFDCYFKLPSIYCKNFPIAQFLLFNFLLIA